MTALRVRIYTDPQHRSVPFVAAGFRRHGIEPKITSRQRECDLAVVWGIKDVEVDLTLCRRVLVFERGYLGKRKRWTAAGFDGLNGLADFHNKHSPSDRWRAWEHEVGPMLPWETRDHGPVLVLGQVPGDASLRGLDTARWCVDMAARLEAAGLPVAIRWHPLAKGMPTKLKYPVLGKELPLKEAVRSSRYVVTFNSNSAVDAVMAGVPAVAIDRGSMAWGVTGRDPLVQPPTPDREQWVHDLMYTQWCREEIEAGDAWEHLRDGMNA